MAPDEMLSVSNLIKSYPVTGTIGAELRRQERRAVRAVDDVTFSVGRREVLGLVGESGSGKTTVARCLVRLVEPDSGRMMFGGQDVLRASGAGLRDIRRRMQLIYQDPYSSLNPRLTVGEAIGEPARVHGLVRGKAAERERVAQLLDAVGLSPGDARRMPRQMSGGQRQRVAIARALAGSPELLIADEAVSALDVSVQAQVLNLFSSLARDRHLAMVFISHQLAVIAQLSHRVAVMYLGRIVEIGNTSDVFSDPRHPYTERLLAAHPVPEISIRTRTPALEGEAPSPLALPQGCRFRSRCPIAEAICAEVDPPPVDLGGGHISFCHVLPARVSSESDASRAARVSVAVIQPEGHAETPTTLVGE